MAIRHHIQDHYVSSVPIVPPACDALALHYEAPEVLACDMNRLYPVIRSCIEEFKKNHGLDIKFSYGAVYRKDGKQRLDCRFENQDADKKPLPLKSTQLKALAYALAGKGCITQEASQYIRDCCEGVIVPLPMPSPVVQSSAKAAGASTVPSPTIMPSRGNHYLSVSAHAANANTPLRLHYILKGPLNPSAGVVDPTIAGDYRTLESSIKQAITSCNQLKSTHIIANVAPATSGGSVNSEFDVEFYNSPQRSPLSYQEVQDLATALFQSGCLNSNEVRALTNSAAAFSVFQHHAAGSSTVSGNAPVIPFPPLYKSCNPIVGRNALSLTYEMNGSVRLSSVMQDVNALRNSIRNVIQALPTRNDGSKIEVAIQAHGSVTNPANGRLMNARIQAEFTRMDGVSKKKLQQQDIHDISAALFNAQCLSQQEAQTLSARTTQAMSQQGWSVTP